MILGSFMVGKPGQAPVPEGQQIFLTPGTTTFIVPEGVTEICVACVAAGGDGAQSPSTTSGGGGACAWSNNIIVTPFESLNIQVGARRTAGSSTSGGNSYVRRGPTNLVLAASGKPFDFSGGAGGQASDSVGDTKFSGRDGGASIGGSAASISGQLSAALFGYGGNGVSFGSTSWTSVSPTGNTEQRRTGASAGGGGAGGGSMQSGSGNGAVIIIWGPGRGFSTMSNSY